MSCSPGVSLTPPCSSAPYSTRSDGIPRTWDRIAAGTLVGHLLECAALVTGGYFADPGQKHVPNIAYIGFPLAEVALNGDAVITKLDGTGGCVTPHTVKEQLFYEVHDPRAYVTPDVVANFSSVRIERSSADRVYVSGASGRPRPPELKVIVGFDGGFVAEAEISYAGLGAAGRAQLAAEIVAERMRNLHQFQDSLRLDLIGMTALHATAARHTSDTQDVRLRAALRTPDREVAETLLYEVEALYNAGPAGGGGFRGRITPSVLTYSTFMDRAAVSPTIEVLTA